MTAVFNNCVVSFAALFALFVATALSLWKPTLHDSYSQWISYIKPRFFWVEDFLIAVIVVFALVDTAQQKCEEIISLSGEEHCKNQSDLSKYFLVVTLFKLGLTIYYMYTICSHCACTGTGCCPCEIDKKYETEDNNCSFLPPKPTRPVESGQATVANTVYAEA